MSRPAGAKVYVVAKGRSLGGLSSAKARRVVGFNAVPISKLRSNTFVVTDDAAGLGGASAPRHWKSSVRVVLLDHVTPTQLDILRARFSKVLAEYEGMKRLPDEQLVEVLAATNAAELVVAGAVDRGLESLVLYRGNLERIVVPLSSFPATADAKPDVGRLEIGEYGHSIRLGEYEASADAILYEHDPLYRRCAKKRLVAESSGLGASIRRLRLQRGIARSDFPGLSEKQIARIERGETEKPRPTTLRRLSERLGVPFDQLTSY